MLDLVLALTGCEPLIFIKNPSNYTYDKALGLITQHHDMIGCTYCTCMQLLHVHVSNIHVCNFTCILHTCTCNYMYMYVDVCNCACVYNWQCTVPDQQVQSPNILNQLPNTYHGCIQKILPRQDMSRVHKGGSKKGGSKKGGSNKGGSNKGGSNKGGSNKGGSKKGGSKKGGSKKGGSKKGGSKKGGSKKGGSKKGGSKRTPSITPYFGGGGFPSSLIP